MSSQVNEYQARAHAALQKLFQLGLRPKDIAADLNISTSMVGHINGIFRHPEFYVSPTKASALEAMIIKVQIHKTLEALHGLPLTVVETCNGEATIVDQVVRRKIGNAIYTGLSKANGTDSPISFDLPTGIAGALAKIGPDAWIIVRDHLRPGSAEKETATRLQIAMLQAEVKKMQVAIHEMQHVINELHDELRDDSSPHYPNAAY